jgi:hypothetical protein
VDRPWGPLPSLLPVFLLWRGTAGYSPNVGSIIGTTSSRSLLVQRGWLGSQLCMGVCTLILPAVYSVVVAAGTWPVWTGDWPEVCIAPGLLCETIGCIIGALALRNPG